MNDVMESPPPDLFDEDDIELAALQRKPACFIITGKPGAGKTTLAKRLAAVWKCQLVDATSTIEQAIRDKTPLGEKAKEKLFAGEALDDVFVGELILEKLHSPEVHHYGYVLDCLPTITTGWKSVEEQFTFLRELDLKPDVIINLKIPTADLVMRREEQKVDPLSNELFIKSVYAPEKPKVKEKEGSEDEEEENEDEEGGDEEETPSEHDEELDDDLIDVENIQHLAPDIAGRLVRRPEDLPNEIKQSIVMYKSNVLIPLENFIIEHNRQYLIELDANLPPLDLFKALLIKLISLAIPRALAPKRLVSGEEDEEEPEGIDSDMFMQQLSESATIHPNFRWRRSCWGRFCPVQLAEGNMVLGRMEFSVGFMDKMYSMSSAESLVKFVRCPRKYLVPPHPLLPCKVCVLGPPLSGKSTLANLIAEKYDAIVINLSELVMPLVQEGIEERVAQAKIDAELKTINAINTQLPEGSTQLEVGTDHPEVLAAIEEEANNARIADFPITVDMYMTALQEGIKTARERTREINPGEIRLGGWVLDGFPVTREQWAGMLQNQLIPDCVISLQDNSEKNSLLVQRVCEVKGIEETTTAVVAEGMDSATGESVPENEVGIHPELQKWQASLSEYESNWAQLSATIKGAAIDPILVDCIQSSGDMLSSATKQMEAVFKHQVSEYSALEGDADIDDDPIIEEVDEEQDEENAEEEQKKRKPWGDAKHFCPVALKEQAILWPGNQDYALRYREKLYYFSSEEAKERFTEDPVAHIALGKPLRPPVFRLLLLGPKASGKTTLGRDLGKQLGIYHVAFRDYLQEQILAKMKKPPLMDAEDFEKPDKEGIDVDTDSKEEEEDEDETLVPLTEEEEAIKAYLTQDEALPEETIEKFINQFWFEEPFNIAFSNSGNVFSLRSAGVIIEGFPSTTDEAEFMATKGLFPDASVILKVGDQDVVNRILPNKMIIWRRKRDKRLAIREAKKQKRIKEWEEDKAKRKAEITAEYETLKQQWNADREEAKEAEDSDDEAEDVEAIEAEEDYKQQIEEIDNEEFEDEEEEEEEETEAEATERIKSQLMENYEEQTQSVEGVQEALTQLLIPNYTISGGRKLHVVKYSLRKVLKPYIEDRESLLVKCTPITMNIAKNLLNHGYKQMSKFGRWCPVKLAEGHTISLPKPNGGTFPLIYREHVYFMSTAEARDQFAKNPYRYLHLPANSIPIPIRLAIVGPPKSGKSTVAKRFVETFGCLRLSVGEAVRKLLDQFSYSELAMQIRMHLTAGETIPDELCVLALERIMMDVQCQTRGYILDGWPLTKDQVDLLNKHRMIPVCIVELQVSDDECLRRGECDRKSPSRTHPLHDSHRIQLIRLNSYHKHIGAVREWYENEHDNWYSVDGERSQWFVWENVKQKTLTTSQQIQHYLERIGKGKAASIANMCITPSEFADRLGDYQEYCPVSLQLNGELVDCSSDASLKHAVEYKCKYYKMSSQEKVEQFLVNPDKYVGELAKKLPSNELLPKIRSADDVKKMFPRQIELKGFCPVTYVNGNMRYESLVRGDPALVVEYDNKLFCFVSQSAVQKFLRCPGKYQVPCLPSKLPPLRQPASLTALPMLGYMEQTVSVAVTNALTATGCFKPKHPFMSPIQSALIYMALHLKAFNPANSEYIRNKYKKKLISFEEQCQLIKYLSVNMMTGYKEPTDRPIDFDHKMIAFLKLDKALAV